MPSALDERVVGYECPEVHQIYWFNLAKVRSPARFLVRAARLAPFDGGPYFSIALCMHGCKARMMLG